MRRPTRFLSFLPALVLALCAVTLLAGCDTNSDEEEEVFAQLQGAWDVVGLQYDGASFLSQLNGRCNDGAVFTFIEQDGNRYRQRVRCFRSNGETVELTSGDLDIDPDDEELSFSLDGIFQEIEVNYDFVDDDLLILTTKDERDTEILFEQLLEDSVDPDNDDENLRVRLRKNNE